MGVDCGPATPLSMSKHHWKNLENFVDHKLLDGKRIMFKYPTLIFAKKGVVLPRPSGWPNIAEKNS